MALKATLLLSTTAVSFSDLHFNRDTDVAAAYERITFAARQVCGPRAMTGSYYTSPGYARCYAQAVDQAIARVNSPELTAFHREQLARHPEASRLATK